MRELQVEVPVGDDATAALLRVPDAGGPCPLLLHCPGWMSTKDAGHYVPYHEAFAAGGIATLIVDYRSLRRSATPTVVDPAEMIADAAAAITFACGRPEVRADLIVVMGSGAVGAGVALAAAGLRSQAAGVVMVSPLASGASWLASMRSPEDYERLLRRVEDDRRAQQEGAPPAVVHPIGGISVPPPERAALGFKRDIADDLPDEVALGTVTRLLRFRPIDELARLAPRPLLLVACRDDVAVPYDDAVQLLETADGPARLLTLEGTTSYRMHQTRWQQIAAEIVAFVLAIAGGTVPGGTVPGGTDHDTHTSRHLDVP